MSGEELHRKIITHVAAEYCEDLSIVCVVYPRFDGGGQA